MKQVQIDHWHNILHLAARGLTAFYTVFTLTLFNSNKDSLLLEYFSKSWVVTDLDAEKVLHLARLVGGCLACSLISWLFISGVFRTQKPSVLKLDNYWKISAAFLFIPVSISTTATLVLLLEGTAAYITTFINVLNNIISALPL